MPIAERVPGAIPMFCSHPAAPYRGILCHLPIPPQRSSGAEKTGYWILAIDMMSANTPAAVTDAPAP